MGKLKNTNVCYKQIYYCSLSIYLCSVAQLYPTLCDPMDCSPLGSSVHGILQARILEWVAKFSSRGSSQPRDRPKPLVSPALAGRFFTTNAIWEALYICIYIFFLLCPKWVCRAGLIKTLITISRHSFYSAKNKCTFSIFGKTQPLCVTQCESEYILLHVI